jgi:hypothetical protein
VNVNNELLENEQFAIERKEKMDNKQTNPEYFETPVSQSRPRARSHGGGWAGGVILIGLGILLLLQNLASFHLNNWWALFILIPAVGGLGAAWSNYQEAGRRMTRAVRSSLFGALVLMLITAIFLFSLDWFIFGPLLLILAGGVLLINTILPE